MENANSFTFPFPFQKLDAYVAARELAVRVHQASIRDGELRDQASRASKSVFLNLSEGLPDVQPAMRRKYFASADGSLHEVVAAIDLASALGALASRLRGMIRGLVRASGRAG